MKLAKAYEPAQYEPDIYAMWETAGVFNPKPAGQGEPFSIVMPPPNANGNLHIGHALTMNYQDILVRYHRMKGDNAVYLPGADHAGFETWVVYERVLAEQGKSRFDFSREQLYSQVWDFVEKQRGNMELQLRALGVGASWDNLTFTLDDKVIDTVYATFRKMWDDGLIYRGERIVNYSTAYQTSYSDIEVNYKEEEGKLWQIAYPLIDKIGEIVVATTRPETMFGDVAIAVHPDDERYKHLIGSHALLPLTQREIPIIADEYVDAGYGTGVVKITPAHDPNDFEVGQRHNLTPLQVIAFDGTMINVPPSFAGLSVDEARTKTITLLKGEDLLRGETTITHTVGYDYKSGLPIQPMIKEQWFVNVKPLAARAIECLERGEITFTPESKRGVLIEYLKNLRDWNISRQIPWGIPIPAFVNKQDSNDWIFDTHVDQKEIVVNGTTYMREEDTFDTWFSSGQWPYITTDALTEGSELRQFYPTSVMATGADILFPWVSRMVMLGLYRTGQVPFRHVYFNGLVLDEKGQKMSKSKGNVINPIEIVSEYGSDALRLGIVSSRSAAQNQALSVSKIVAGRNFCNKLWNMSRYTLSKLGDEPVSPHQATPQTPAEHWIAKQLSNGAAAVAQHLENFRFAEAGETVYHVIWDDVADWYIEASKVGQNPAFMAWVLEACLRLAHPFAPFVTETIWQTLPWVNSLLAGETWPEPLAYSPEQVSEFADIRTLVEEVRNAASSLPGSKRYDLLHRGDDFVAQHADTIAHLGKLKAVTASNEPFGLKLAASTHHAWLAVDEATLYEHRTNLQARLESAQAQLATLHARLANQNYRAKAPAHLVAETELQHHTTQQLVERLQAELSALGQ